MWIFRCLLIFKRFDGVRGWNRLCSTWSLNDKRQWSKWNSIVSIDREFCVIFVRKRREFHVKYVTYAKNKFPINWICLWAIKLSNFSFDWSFWLMRKQLSNCRWQQQKNRRKTWENCRIECTKYVLYKDETNKFANGNLSQILRKIFSEFNRKTYIGMTNVVRRTQFLFKCIIIFSPLLPSGRLRTFENSSSTWKMDFFRYSINSKISLIFNSSTMLTLLARRRKESRDKTRPFYQLMHLMGLIRHFIN